MIVPEIPCGGVKGIAFSGVLLVMKVITNDYEGISNHPNYSADHTCLLR